MCGRYSLGLNRLQLEEVTGRVVPAEYKPSYNIAPTQSAAVILNTQPDRIELLRFGLIPAWSVASGNKGYTMINARAETLGAKATFRALVGTKRCVVLADGYYEWKKVETVKEPYRIVSRQGLLHMAGLWTESTQEDGSVLRSFSIITVPPNDLLSAIHDRMPVLLTVAEMDNWLTDGDVNLLDAAPSGDVNAFRVSVAVNNPRNNSSNLIVPLALK